MKSLVFKQVVWATVAVAATMYPAVRADSQVATTVAATAKPASNSAQPQASGYSTRTTSSDCRPGSFEAIAAAKLPPSARPGSPDLYKNCR